MRPVGWRYDSWRHSLAAKGVRTGRRFEGELKRRYDSSKLGEIAAKRLAASRMVEDTEYPIDKALFIMRSPRSGGIFAGMYGRDSPKSVFEDDPEDEFRARRILSYRIKADREQMKDDIEAMSAFPPEEKFGEFPVGKIERDGSSQGWRFKDERDPNSHERVQLPKGWFAKKEREKE